MVIQMNESKKDKIENALIDCKKFKKMGMSYKEILENLDPDIPLNFRKIIAKKSV